MINSKNIHLNVTIDDALIPLFFPLLGKGFKINATLGCSIRDFLCRQLGLSAEYLEDRIQTVFLNGKAVDDLDAAPLNLESVLALSGAMPGLAGATLRRGGHLSKMRGEISHENESVCRPGKEGKVTLKLFNLTLKDLGPMFLKNGIWIVGKDLYRFFHQQSDHIRAVCQVIEFEGNPTEVTSLNNMNRDNTDVLLKLQSPCGTF
jgi:hypothetical protein